MHGVNRSIAEVERRHGKRTEYLHRGERWTTERHRTARSERMGICKDEHGHSHAQTWKMIAPPRLALITISLFDQSSRFGLRVTAVSEKSRLSMETKNVV